MRELFKCLGFASSLLLIVSGLFWGFALMGVVFIADKGCELIDHR